jgi:hypothetical protein
MKTKLLLLLLVMLSVARTDSAARTDPSVWAVDFVKTGDGRQADYVKFLEQNWAQARAFMKKRGIANSYQVLSLPAGQQAEWDVLLITEYVNRTGYEKREEVFNTQLAEFLRYSLLHNNAQEVALGEEIEAVRNYLAIEKTRFEERLEVEFRIDQETENLPAPSFLLNPLVENAIKHGLNSSTQPLKIRVSAQLRNGVLRLEVANTGSLSHGSDGTKVGLRNIRERIEKLYGGRGSFELAEEDGWVCARITLG